jgi:regulator of RNase E activity RraB
MVKRKKQRRVTNRDLKLGTLFRVPLKDGTVVLGQIVRPGVVFYACIYAPPLKADEPGSCAIGAMRPILCCLMTDEAFYHGRWIICGQAAVHPDVPLPYFKVNRGGIGMVVKDLSGNIVRRASAEDIKRIPYERIVDELIVTTAVEALLSGNSVAEDAQHMLVDFIKDRSTIAPILPNASEAAPREVESFAANSAVGPSCAGDPDAEVLAAMANAGADLSKPHDAEFALVFPSAKSARAATKELGKLGYSATMGTSEVNDEDVWVTVNKRVVLDPMVLRVITTDLKRVAEQHQGEFDGWGAEIEE